LQGEFVLTHPRVSVPESATIYSINEGNAANWDAATAKYVEECKRPPTGGPAFSARYVGSMVADVHRTLLYGGIFMYPADKKSPKGKLRMLVRKKERKKMAALSCWGLFYVDQKGFESGERVCVLDHLLSLYTC
jgi:fructose-1,6-bisphosphatase